MADVALLAPSGHHAKASGSGLLRPAILLLLRARESHGYELMARLAQMGVEVTPTTGGLYRSLRTMAAEELLSSYWSTPERGPARRVYAITEAGEEHLAHSVPALASFHRTVGGMLRRYQGKGGGTASVQKRSG